MQGLMETAKVAKKSESRKHAAAVRVDAQAMDRAKLAAHLMGLSLADWTTATLVKQAEIDIQREAAKLVAGSPAEPKAKPKAARS